MLNNNIYEFYYIMLKLYNPNNDYYTYTTKNGLYIDDNTNEMTIFEYETYLLIYYDIKNPDLQIIKSRKTDKKYFKLEELITDKKYICFNVKKNKKRITIYHNTFNFISKDYTTFMLCRKKTKLASKIYTLIYKYKYKYKYIFIQNITGVMPIIKAKYILNTNIIRDFIN